MNFYKYAVRPDDSFWDDFLARNKEEEIRNWCREKFGPEYTSRWGLFIDGFNFNDEKDYMLFILRWS